MLLVNRVKKCYEKENNFLTVKCHSEPQPQCIPKQRRIYIERSESKKKKISRQIV